MKMTCVLPLVWVPSPFRGAVPARETQVVSPFLGGSAGAVDAVVLSDRPGLPLPPSVEVAPVEERSSWRQGVGATLAVMSLCVGAGASSAGAATPTVASVSSTWLPQDLERGAGAVGEATSSEALTSERDTIVGRMLERGARGLPVDPEVAAGVRAEFTRLLVAINGENLEHAWRTLAGNDGVAPSERRLLPLEDRIVMPSVYYWDRATPPSTGGGIDLIGPYHARQETRDLPTSGPAVPISGHDATSLQRLLHLGTAQGPHVALACWHLPLAEEAEEALGRGVRQHFSLGIDKHHAIGREPDHDPAQDPPLGGSRLRRPAPPRQHGGQGGPLVQEAFVQPLMVLGADKVDHERGRNRASLACPVS